MDMQAPRILIGLWGHFRLVERAGRKVDVASRKARACLALLARADARSLSRERLAGLLWSDRPDEQARANLRQLLYELKPLSRPGSDVFAFDRHSVWLGPDCVSDVDFMSHMPAAGLAAMLPERGIVLLSDLDGISEEFDDWLASERASVETALRRCVQQRAEEALAEGDFAAARGLVDGWMRRDASDETMARLGLRADAALADRVGLRQRLERLNAALVTELGVRPESSTLALVEELEESAAATGIDVPEADIGREAAQHDTRGPVVQNNRRQGRAPRLMLATLAVGALVAVAVLTWPTPRPSAMHSKAVAMATNARALSHGRTAAGYRQAVTLARKAVALDPDCAPAWAELAAATWLLGATGPKLDIAPSELRSEVGHYLQRALAHEPKSGRALAVQGLMVGGAAGGVLLERAAVAEDDAETWIWLGNWRDAAGHGREALAAYRRAAEIDPLWDRSVYAYVGYSEQMGESTAADEAIERFAAASPNTFVVASLRAQVARSRGDLVAAARYGRTALALAPDDPWIQLIELVEVARAVGDVGAIRRLTAQNRRMRESVVPLLEPAQALSRVEPAPNVWLERCAYCSEDARQLLRAGRADQLVAAIERRGGEPLDTARAASGYDLEFAELLVVALRDVGREKDAEQLLKSIARRLEKDAARDYAHELQVAVALALQGRADEAVQRLDDAVAKGWRGQSRSWAVDPADEPAFAGLVGRNDFEASRLRLAVERDHSRAEVSLILADTRVPQEPERFSYEP